jgi:hypothetical protein
MAAVTSAVVAGVAAVGSAVQSRKQAKKAASAQKKTQAAQEKQQSLERGQAQQTASKARRRQIKQSRIQRALVENQAEASGQGGSSAPIAGAQNVTQQAGSNIAGITTAAGQGTALAAARQNVANARVVPIDDSGLTQLFQAASGLSSGGKNSSINTIFG